jgi:hypothetical protein
MVVGLAAPAAAGPSTWYVTAGGTGDCSSLVDACGSLTTALGDASAGDTIVVSGAVATDVTIDESITIDGTDGSSPGSLTGTGTSSVLTVDAGDTVTLYSLTISGNSSDDGSGIGGGINNNGTLVLNDCTVSGNTVTAGGNADSGGGINNTVTGTLTLNSSTVSGNGVSGGTNGGGGISNSGTLNVNDSTISDNTQSGDNQVAGGILNNGTLTVNSSTVSGNVASGGGYAGGITSMGALTLSTSTVSGNSATVAGGVFLGPDTTATVIDSTIADNSGENASGGLFTEGQDTIVSSTIADDTAPNATTAALELLGGTVYLAGDLLASSGGPDGNECFDAGLGGTIVDDGYNIDDDGTCQLSSSTSVSDSSTIDSFLGPLQNNGGQTDTIALLPTSTTRNPAQATIPSQFVAPGQSIPTCSSPDQRGDGRGVQCDMGSYALPPGILLAPAIYSPDSTTFTTGELSNYDVAGSGSPALTYSETGALPSGITFSSSTGALEGTPAALSGGIYPLVIDVSNGVSPDATQSFTLTVDQAPAITSASGTDFTRGVPGSFTVTATGFPQPTFSEVGTLPPGVTLDSSTGVLFGTPGELTYGSYSITITASNGISPAATQSFTVVVLAVISAASATFTIGAPNTFTVTTAGIPGGPPFALTDDAGTLPQGVTFTDNGNGTATLSGTPAVGTGGVYPLNITATNGETPDIVQAFVLTVGQAPVITSADSATFTAGTPGDFQMTVNGSPAPSFFETGLLPIGVSLTTSGLLAGTPPPGSGGRYPFTITASNRVSPNATQDFVLTVDQAPAITSSAGATFTVGSPGSLQVVASGYPAPTFSEVGGLPAGVTFTSSGLLSGTPTGTAGAYDLTITATNGLHPVATQTFVLTITKPAAAPGCSSTGVGSADFPGGYWLAEANGAVYSCGDAPFYGSLATLGVVPNQPIVGIASTPDDRGYWLAASDGGIFAFGDAVFYGSMGAHPLDKPVVGIAGTSQGGYYEVASDGGIFSFGPGATFYGSMGGQALNQPVVGMAVTSGGGYDEVASDGGIFSFGPGATFYGSMGGQALNQPVVGIALTGQGGYWEVASDGGLFSFGPGATFYGSMGGKPINQPVVGMMTSPAGGYYEVASDGGLFSFGDAPFAGSTGGQGITGIVGMASSVLQPG